LRVDVPGVILLSSGFDVSDDVLFPPLEVDVSDPSDSFGTKKGLIIKE
jgi:hypothetical protein